jgi:hypothetical protein
MKPYIVKTKSNRRLIITAKTKEDAIREIEKDGEAVDVVAPLGTQIP